MPTDCSPEDGKNARPSGFVQIERTFLRDFSLSGDAKLVGCVMAAYANAGHLAWPGTKTLARLTGFGRNKVNRARAELVRRKYLLLIQSRAKQFRFGTARYEVTSKILHPAKRSGANENAPSDRVHGTHARGRKPQKARG